MQNIFFGMRITRDKSTCYIYLSQIEYRPKILKRFDMENAKPISTQLPMRAKLSKSKCPKSDEEREIMSKIPYQSTVGSLMYAMIATRLDIALH